MPEIVKTVKSQFILFRSTGDHLNSQEEVVRGPLCSERKGPGRLRDATACIISKMNVIMIVSYKITFLHNF